MTAAALLQDTLADGVVQLTFNRPDKMNALSTPMLEAFDSALTEIADDNAVRVVVLRGAGGKAFVAGADIAEYRGDQTTAFIAYQRRGRKVFDKLERLPQPTIAAIDGYALGGGFEIALCCDIIICSESAQLGLPEVHLGLCPGGGGTQRLARAIGKYAASDVLLTGWRMNGARAWQLGLAAECVPADQFDDTVMARVRALLRHAPLAQAAIKQLIREGGDAPLDTAMSYEQEVLFRLYGTVDGREGIAAFLDKRPPQFRGK